MGYIEYSGRIYRAGSGHARTQIIAYLRAGGRVDHARGPASARRQAAEHQRALSAVVTNPRRFEAKTGEVFVAGDDRELGILQAELTKPSNERALRERAPLRPALQCMRVEVLSDDDLWSSTARPRAETATEPAAFVAETETENDEPAVAPEGDGETRRRGKRRGGRA